jgi:putative ABC transport system permease protein
MIISFFTGVLIAIVVYKATQELAGIPMKMTMENLGITLLLAVVVGVGTGLLTIGRLRRADPAELFCSRLYFVPCRG